MAAALSAALAACGGGGDSRAEADPPAAAEPSASADFSAPAKPLKVRSQVDAARSVSMVVARGGGTLTVTAADGTRFTLSVPARTFSADTRITLTPVTELRGSPFAAGTSAVLIEPADARLSQLATLVTETPPSTAPAGQTPFSVRGSGEGELHLLPAVAEGGATQVRLAHFGVVGTAAVTVVERAVVRARLPTLLADRWSHVVADGIASQKSTSKVRLQSPGNPALPAVAEAYALALLAQASVIPSDCDSAWFYVDTTLRQGMLVTQSVPDAFTSATVRLVFAQVGSLINAATSRCLQELKQQCLAHDLRSLVTMVQWKAAIDGWVEPLRSIDFRGFDFADQAARLIDGCTRFDLDFDSTGTGVAPTGLFEAQVRARMPLRLTEPTLPLRWTGSALLEAQRFVLSGAAGIVTTSYIGSALAIAQELRLVPDHQAAIGVPAPNLPITNVELDYNPGRDLANVLFVGPVGVPVPVVLDGLWLATYSLLHADEYGEGGQSIRDWAFLGGELYARKSWSRSLFGNTTISENTTIELHHRPVLP